MTAPTKPATVAEVQTLCQRVRSAGSPNARARPPLVNEYRRLAVSLGIDSEPVETGLDLQRAAASLLRAAANAEAVAAQSPGARLRRAGRRPSLTAAPAGPGACGNLRLARPRTGVVDLWQQASASRLRWLVKSASVATTRP